MRILGPIVLPQALLMASRPEYHPAWLDRSVVTKLHLEPLAAGDIKHLVQARLGVALLPDGFARLITEKAEGNALFAEEIISFLTERGVLRTNAGKVEFDAGVAAALPASVQSLLTARVDRLAPQDRALLQAAAVIGRRFDPRLVAAVIDTQNVETRLAAMQAFDLVYAEEKSASPRRGGSAKRSRRSIPTGPPQAGVRGNRPDK